MNEELDTAKAASVATASALRNLERDVAEKMFTRDTLMKTLS